MDQIELGRYMGRTEAILEDHGRRLSDLEQSRPSSNGSRLPALLVSLMPWAWGAVVIGLAIAGKLTVLEAIRAMGGGGQ
jgi:hypothetical protein